MLPCNEDTAGLMDISLTQIGLLIATSVLLCIVFSFIFFNDWQRTSELQAQSSQFSNLLSDIDNSFFERTSLFQFSQGDYPYTVSISSEYLRVSAKGFWKNDLIVVKKFLPCPWICGTQQNWSTGEDLQTCLNESFGHRGTQGDPISSENFTTLCQERDDAIAYYAVHPLGIILNRPVYVEKVTIYYNQTQRQDFLLVYQRYGATPPR